MARGCAQPLGSLPRRLILMDGQPPLHRLVRIALLGLLLLAFALPQGVAASELFQVKRNRSTLCGRLVFLEDYKTQARLIGLIPCNENRPLIFAARPGELYEFYRLTNVVIKKGDRVNTLAYGVLENYITQFESFKEIYSCRDCDANAPAQAPASAAQASGCSGWVLEQAATGFPAINPNQELRTLQTNLEAYANGTVVKQACGVDSACRIGATAQQMGVQLGPRLSWAGVSEEQASGWLDGLLSNPAALEACPALNVIFPKLVAGLSQQGYSLDLAMIGKTCDLLASDAQGRQSGFLEGSPVQQIPGAVPATTAGYQYLLYPSGSAARLALACTQSDTINLQLVQRETTGIREYLFNRLLVGNKTRGEIDLAASPLVLSLEPRGDGVTQERKPDRSLLHPALVAPMPSPTPPGVPASATTPPNASTPAPTQQPADKPTALPPSPTPAPAEPPTPPASPPSARNPLCPLAPGIAIPLTALYWMRRRSKRQITAS